MRALARLDRLTAGRHLLGRRSDRRRKIRDRGSLGLARTRGLVARDDAQTRNLDISLLSRALREEPLAEEEPVLDHDTVVGGEPQSVLELVEHEVARRGVELRQVLVGLAEEALCEVLDDEDEGRAPLLLDRCLGDGSEEVFAEEFEIIDVLLRDASEPCGLAGLGSELGLLGLGESPLLGERGLHGLAGLGLGERGGERIGGNGHDCSFRANCMDVVYCTEHRGSITAT